MAGGRRPESKYPPVPGGPSPGVRGPAGRGRSRNFPASPAPAGLSPGPLRPRQARFAPGAEMGPPECRDEMDPPGARAPGPGPARARARALRPGPRARPGPGPRDPGPARGANHSRHPPGAAAATGRAPTARRPGCRRRAARSRSSSTSARTCSSASPAVTASRSPLRHGETCRRRTGDRSKRYLRRSSTSGGPG